MRISIKDVRILAARLNQIMGTPDEPYSRGEDDQFHANVGNYHVSRVGGGYNLHQMQDTRGGVREVFGLGHMPSRMLYELMRAYMQGIEDGKALAAIEALRDARKPTEDGPGL